MTLEAADGAQIDAWWRRIQGDPSRLPDGVDHVQSRLVRAVGRATLPSGGWVYLKQMGFPRPKDKLRYALRRLPALHEADVLRHLAECGVGVPEVIFAGGARRAALPHACLLVTRALPVVEASLVPDAVLDVVFELRAAGVFHPDLHSDNFLVLETGSVAVLDMQSARRSGDDSLAALERMLVTLIAHIAYRGRDISPWCDALRARGIDEMTILRLARVADHVNQRALVGRLQRCLRESTQFAVRRGLTRTVYERRAMHDSGEWVAGGGELFRYWMGDRALEILDGATPVLAALDRPRFPFGAGYRVRVPGGEPALREHVARLGDGFRRYEERITTRV